MFTGESPGAIAEKVQEKVLSNGLKVILLENHKVPEVTHQVWYRVGSRNENWGKTGLSHMLEHMMFKGTPKNQGGKLTRAIEEIGGNDNAFTSHDFTAYFENINSGRIQIPIDLEADRMQNLLLKEEDFRTERKVILEERRLRTEDNPQSYLAEQVEATAFQTSPYHWPIIGWYEDIERVSLEELKRYYKTYYNPANAFLVIVGDLKKDDLLPLLEKTFGSIPQGEAPDQQKGIDPPQSGERRIMVTREAELPFIMMGYHVPNLNHQDSYVLEVIAAILSGGRSSRFNRNLVREKQLALSANADNALLSKDPHLFTISAQLFPGREVGEMEKALDLEIKRLQKELLGPSELEKVKNQLEAAFIYSQDSLFSQAMILARYEIVGSWKLVDSFLPSIRKITREDIQRVAGKYLIPGNRTVGVLIPLPPKEGGPAEKIPSRSGPIIR
ncbi:MAG: insulinase family protein [Deltaproteobacteria bacterium]|nr:insulinase family protein [Deltaproteobacteria bacterium]